MIKAIIFDAGGVLVVVSTAPKNFRLQNMLIEAGGQKLRDDAFSSRISEKVMWQELEKRLNLPKGHTKKMQKFILDKSPLDKKVFKLATKLSKKYKTAIISDGIRSIFRRWCKRFGFNKVFPTRILSADIKMTKPYTPIFRYTLRRLNVKPSEALFIDDLAVNVRGAKKAGIAAFRYNGKNYSELVSWLKKHGVEV